MSKDIKARILHETRQLIEEKGSDLDKITIREICDRAGIGAGLVNYHFQTKENLIRQCVQQMIFDVIGQYDSVYQTLSGKTPIEKLRYMAKSTCSYLDAHENLSRISIVTDMTSHQKKDNTSQTAAAYYPLFRNACPDSMSDEEVKRRTYLMILTLQAFFLRSTVLKDEIGIDFHHPEERDQLVDDIIDKYLGI
jgi:AcrR family transcriptional regulator